MAKINHEDILAYLEEASILEFVSNLDAQQLKSIIYMSLDMDVKIGHPDKLTANEF